jgi:hypothetical protein
VAVLAMVGTAAFAATRPGAGQPPTADILTATDDRLGHVSLVAQPQPHVVVSIDQARPYTGTRHCELQRSDGTWVEVGTWQLTDLAEGIWVAGIDPDLLDARTMRITTDDGAVLATATF